MPRKPSRRHAPTAAALLLALLITAAAGLPHFVQPTAYAAAAFAVNSKGDGADSNTADNLCDDGTGNCTLRAAIQQANATAGADTITFNIPGGGAQTVTISADLPEVTGPVVIDATTQPGYAGSPLVEVRGGGTRVAGFVISAGDSTVRGLSITGLQNEAIVLKTKGNNRVEGNYIGLTPAGTVFSYNLEGVLILDSSNNVVGGTSAAQRNVISANALNGVRIWSNQPSVGPTTGNVVQGNFIGTNPAGTSALGNGNAGVAVTSAKDNTIGGTATGAGNLISGNSIGVEFNSEEPFFPTTYPTGNAVQGNLIGTNAAGTAALPNNGGIYIAQGNNNLIGGAAAGARNVISGNGSDGVSIDSSTQNNSVQGNFIGTDVTGAAPLRNNGGMFLRGTGNLVGGSAEGAGNVIAFNQRHGVFLDNPAQNCAIRRNSIHSNGELGIDLGANASSDGVTPNDTGDGDTGANGRQNFPVLTSVSEGGASIQIQGTLNSKPSTAYTIDFYASQTCDPSGHGEGQVFVGETTATTDSSGNALFNVLLPTPASGRVITATATDPAGNTSEFSACDSNLATASLQFTATTFNAAEDLHSVTVTVTRTGDTSGAVAVNYATADGTASQRTDYTAAAGTLNFAAGEGTKEITVLITDDSYQEGDETINLTLSNPSGGTAVLGSPASATVIIQSNDFAQPAPNAIDDSRTFVREHYHDFLNREPDASGLDHWTNVIESCGQDAQCREVNRINVSAAFFLSIEFQQTGYLVERIYKAAYGDATGTSTLGGTTQTLTVPIVRFEEFLPDTQRIGRGVVVLAPGWEEQLEANKTAFTQEFVQRPRFLAAFPTTMSPTAFVDQLNTRAGNPLDAAERQALIDELTAGNNSTAARASVLRKVAEDPTLEAAERNRAFVLIEYFGYLRRDPNEGQDTDYTGYHFWLTNLEKFNGNFVQAELVKAFISSDEYRKRFGQ